MPTQLKVAAYIVSALAVVAMFFSALRPYLLQNPPNPVALAIVGFSMAFMLYAIIMGPFKLIGLRSIERARAQRILNQSFWVFIVGAVLGIISPDVPVVTPAALLSFALIAAMLRAAARYFPRVA